jgi:FtsH-binding integral membrane protein
MSDLYGSLTGTRAPSRVSTATIFGQVMFLVGLAIGFLAVGSLIGRDLAYGSARILGFVAIGMLFAQSFAAPLRTGPLGIAWLFGLALLLGLSLGPVLSFYASSDPTTVTQAAGR